MSDFAKDINVPTNDCISRQAAVDALADMHCKSDEDGYVWIIRSDAWARIDALPSAQPERLTDYSFEESCTDCPAYDTENHRCPRFNQVIRRALKDANLEPCEDCISRQAAIDAIHCDITVTGRQNAELVAATIGAFADRIKALPSVTPKQKTGKWIYGENLGNGHDGYFCSECGWFAAVDYDFPINSEENKPTNFCPNCGARMTEEDV